MHATATPLRLRRGRRRRLRRAGTWPPKGIETFDPWHLPLLNTLILLLTSGTTVTWAHHALLEDDRKGLKYRPDPHRDPRRLLHLRAGL